MWWTCKITGAYLRLLEAFEHRRVCSLWRTGSGRGQRRLSSFGPPWRLLFFGSDNFAVESLKLLTSSRSSNEGIVGSLEVVTLSGDAPVKRFAQHHKLPLQIWPPPKGGGDGSTLGVVVSFGCLLPESLLNKFPHGVLNVHPSLLPRWRGPAPVFHTIPGWRHGDGVTVMQIRPSQVGRRCPFDVGPILSQELHPVSSTLPLCLCPSLQLMETLGTLSDKAAHQKEQSKIGIASTCPPPEVSTPTLWLFAVRLSCSRTPHAHTHTHGSDGKHFKERPRNVPPKCLSCNLSLIQDGWVGFKAVLLKKRLTAADFYNGYLHRTGQGAFVSRTSSPARL
uniref:Mitochondrial methionyl-tRNA formyltransferase n=1 Tax=Takifugu rubripes TaxID=31033 RepID=A0A674NSC0_TAKRU